MGYESRYGVRSLKRTLMDNVEEPLSTLIIDGKLHEGDTVVRRIGQAARRPDTRGMTDGRFPIFPLKETGFRTGLSFCFIPPLFYSIIA